MAKGKSADASVELENRLPLEEMERVNKLKRLQSDEDLPAGELVELDSSLQELQEKLVAEGMSGGSLRLERRGPMDNAFGYIGKMKTANFDIEQVKKMYGGGSYQVEFFRANGQKAGRHTFEIDPRFIGAIELTKGKEDTSNSVNPALVAALVSSNRPDPAAGNMVQAMIKQSSDSMTLMVTMMMKSAETQMAMMTGMFQSMRQAPVNVSPGHGMDFKDLIMLLPLLKQEGKPAPTMLELVETMKGLKELGSGEAAVAEPKGTLDKLLEALPHVASTVSALRGGPAPVLAAPSAGPVRAQVVAPRPVAIAPSPATEKMATIQNGMLMLVKAAREGRDVDLYHDMILELMDDGDLEMLKTALTQPQWFTTLFGQISDAPSFQPWMTRLRDALLETLNTPDPVVESPHGSPEHPVESPAPAGGPDPVVLQPGRDAGGSS